MQRCCEQQKSKGWRCPILYPISDDPKCPKHRAAATRLYERRKASGKLKEAQDRYKKTDKGKARQWRSDHSPAGIAKRKRFRASEKGKASDKRAKTSTKGRARARKYDRKRSKLMSRKVHRSMISMLRGVHRNPSTVPSLGLFADNASATDHFEKLFEPWMNHNNYGKHLSKHGYDVRWNIGHKIPTAVYDRNDPSEVAKAYAPENLFPQDAKENAESGATVHLYSDEELLALKHVWPSGVLSVADLRERCVRNNGK